ncbi:MAG TPA: sigma-70 family RNA polymerase sigma factor [Myxococcota bacterium]|nr:sigma-70 family RNA polymerase sigma factor [Myxococcota bacterium]HND32930.1 sigma-70 family RNA polymerase sigma factor [Myxococcota bacterium]
MQNRNELIIKYHPLVKAIASRMARRYPSNVDLDDLITVGSLGLIAGVDKFDNSMGVPFKPYAEMKIRGAIIDWLRTEDWVSRPQRDVQRQYERTHARLTQRLGREPEREEMAAELKMTLEAFDRFRRRAKVSKLVSTSARDSEANPDITDGIPSDDPLPDSLWEEEETRLQVIETIRRLPEKEQEVVMRYDIQGASLKDIGEELGITESRVCQIRATAHKKLRVWLARLVEED